MRCISCSTGTTASLMSLSENKGDANVHLIGEFEPKLKIEFDSSNESSQCDH